MIHSPAGRIYFAGDTGYGTGTILRAMRDRPTSP